MSFLLVYGDNEASLQLNFDHPIEDRLLELLFERTPQGQSRVELQLRIVEAVSAAVNDVDRPTDKQVRYADAIAKLLGLNLSPLALTSRPAMRRFLNAHAESYRKECARRRASQ